MNITFDIEDSVPLFSQLIIQIKEAIAAEKVLPSAALPSILPLPALKQAAFLGSIKMDWQFGLWEICIFANKDMNEISIWTPYRKNDW